MKLKDKVAIVTGGASGIGKAISELFLKEGARVIVFDIKEPDFEVEYYKVDVSNEKEIKNAFDKIEKLDVLVNNAGIYFQSSVENTSKKDLDRIIDIDFKGTYLMSKHALPLIKESKGNIVNISSGIGVVPEPDSPAYCSTKAAVIMLTKCMAQEYAQQKVRVNAILPGPIDTPLLRNAFSSEEEMNEYKNNNPMKKIGKPEDVAKVALFLASEDANFVTGGLYEVDGGEASSSLFSK